MFTTRPTSTQSPASVAPPRRGRATRFMALLATATVGAVCMNTAAASAQITAEMSASADITATTTADIFPTAHRVFELKNAYSQNVADVAGAATTAGTRLIQWPAHGGANQRFAFSPATLTNGATGTTITIYRIRNQHSDLCLEPVRPAGGGIAVHQAVCSSSFGQFWELNRNSYGYYTIKNVDTKTFLHVRNKTTGTELSLNDEFGVTDRMWALRETKLPYSVDTPGVTVPWGALGIYEIGYCNDGWRVELDAGTWNPRYNNIGDSGVKITGNIFFTGDLSKFSVLTGVDRSQNDPRKIQLNYYQNSGTDSSRNYALTGRVRFYCVPGTTF